MILVRHIGGDAVVFQIGTKLMFYFKLGGREDDIFDRAIKTVALVKALGEAVKKGMLTAWS